jgi:hypothetical protein
MTIALAGLSEMMKSGSNKGWCVPFTDKASRLPVDPVKAEHSFFIEIEIVGQAEGDGRARLRDRQGGDGLPAIPAPGTAQG